MKSIYTLLLALTVNVCHAQTDKILSLSRNEAMVLGLKNRYDIKANDLNIQIAKTKIRQARNNWLPDVSGSGQVIYSPQLQNSVLPGGVLPGYPDPTLVPLTVKNQTILGLNLFQPVLNTNLVNEQKLAKNQLLVQQEKNKATEIDIMLQISRSYLDVQLRSLQAQIAASNAGRNKQYEILLSGMLKNGTIIENQYLKAKLDRENADQLYQQAVQNHELSLMQLRYQLNLDKNVKINLSDSLTKVYVEPTGLDPVNTKRSEIRQLELEQEGFKINIKKYQQDLLPSISFGANYSQQYLSDNFKYGAGKWWSPFSSVSLNIHIPISAHFKRRANINEYRQRIQQNELLLQQRAADIEYEVREARTNLLNAVNNMNGASHSYELSKIIYKNHQQQFQLGAFDYSALLETEKTLSATENNYVQSAYNLMLAQIRLQKATNNFNQNN